MRFATIKKANKKQQRTNTITFSRKHLLVNKVCFMGVLASIVPHVDGFQE